MNPFFFLSGFSWREHRLCFQNVHPSGLDAPNLGHIASERTAEATWNETFRDIEKNLGDAKNFILGRAQGFAHSWEQALKGNPEKIQELNRQVAFLRNAPPQLQLELAKEFDSNTVSVDAMAALCDLKKWFDVFAMPDTYDIAQTAVDAPVWDPKSLLLKLPKERRKEIFLSFVDLYLPSQAFAQDAQKSLFKTELTNDPAARFEAIKPDERELLLLSTQRTLGADLTGVEKLKHDRADLLARKALEYRYGLGDAKAPSNKNLSQDFAERVRLLQLKDPHAPITALNLSQPGELSSFAGLLNMKLLPDERIQSLSNELGDIQRERIEMKDRVAREALALKGEVSESAKEEANSIYSMMQRMNGVEKLVLISAILYGAFKYRKAALFLTGVYFFAKFGLKQEDPIKSGFDLIDKAVNGVGKVAKGGIDFATQPDDVPARMDRYIGFLREYDQQGLDAEIEAYDLLADQRLSTLAQAYSVQGDADGWALTIAPGSELDVMLQKASPLVKERFFQNPHTMLQANDAIGYLFYVAASREPKHAALVRKVKEGLGQLKTGESILDLVGAPRDAYEYLVRAGKEICLSRNGTVGDFIRSSVQQSPNMEIPKAPSKVVPKTGPGVKSGGSPSSGPGSVAGNTPQNSPGSPSGQAPKTGSGNASGTAPRSGPGSTQTNAPTAGPGVQAGGLNIGPGANPSVAPVSQPGVKP